MPDLRPGSSPAQATAHSSPSRGYPEAGAPGASDDARAWTGELDASPIPAEDHAVYRSRAGADRLDQPLGLELSCQDTVNARPSAEIDEGSTPCVFAASPKLACAAGSGASAIGADDQVGSEIGPG